MPKEKVEWIWKHYIGGDTDLIKCNHCEKTFSDRDQMHDLQYHLCDEHEITELDEHPERDGILKHFKISSITATCNHCNKKINLAIHGVHTLTLHLKIVHSITCVKKKKKKERIKIDYRRTSFDLNKSRVWDDYDVIDNIATCKGCNKIFKIDEYKYALSNLRVHLLYCHHFDKRNKYKTKEIGRDSQVWDDYEVIDSNYAECKECKNRIKINNKFPATSLKNHMFRCRKVWDKFVVTGNIAKCKGCEKTVKMKSTMYRTLKLKTHLFICLYFLNHSEIPDKYKLEEEKEKEEKETKSRIWLKYDVTGYNARCKECAKIITVNNAHPTRNLYQHARYCRLNKIRRRSCIWDKFDMVDNNATCKECKQIIKLSSRHATSKLNQHLLYRHFDHPDKYEVTNEPQGKPKKSTLWSKYDIMSNNYVACKRCKKLMKLHKYNPTYKLGEHYVVCNFLSKYPSKYTLRPGEIKRKLHLFNKYNITDNKAKCKGCKRTLKINSKYPTLFLKSHLLHCCYYLNHPEKLGEGKTITCKRKVCNRKQCNDAKNVKKRQK